SERNVVFVEFAARVGPAVFAVFPIENSRTLVGHVVLLLLLFPLQAGALHRFGFGRALAGRKAELPFLAFEVLFVDELRYFAVEMPVLGLGGVPVLGFDAGKFFVVPLLVVLVVIVPTLVGRVIRVRG